MNLKTPADYADSLLGMLMTTVEDQAVALAVKEEIQHTIKEAMRHAWNNGINLVPSPELLAWIKSLDA